MSLPLSANVTCDIYRAGFGPPAAPSVPGVAGFLAADYGRGVEAGELSSGPYRFTHTLLVGPTVDVRDDYHLGTIGVLMDTVYVPDQNGTAFKVVFVERRQAGGGPDHKKAYLIRQPVSWPSDNL